MHAYVSPRPPTTRVEYRQYGTGHDLSRSAYAARPATSRSARSITAHEPSRRPQSAHVPQASRPSTKHSWSERKSAKVSDHDGAGNSAHDVPATSEQSAPAFVSTDCATIDDYEPHVFQHGDPYGSSMWLERFDMLSRIVGSITMELRHDALAKCTARVAGILTKSQFARVYWHNSASRMLEDAVSGKAYSVGRGIAGLVMRTEDALSVPVAAKHPAFDYEVDCAGGSGYPCGSDEPLVPLLAVPIALQRGRASGVVLVWGSQLKTAFGPDDVTLLRIVARQCAIVEAHATEKLEQEAVQARVDADFARALRQTRPCAAQLRCSATRPRFADAVGSSAQHVISRAGEDAVDWPHSSAAADVRRGRRGRRVPRGRGDSA